MKTLILFLLFISFLFADTIVLKNGKTVQGYVTFKSLEYVIIQSNKSNFVIPLNQVALIDDCKNYTRMMNEDLQTKIITLKKGDKTFVLTSMVHVGDKRFYREIESILDKNQLVLYEAFGVTTNDDFSKWEIPSKRYHAKPERYTSYSNHFYEIARILGLQIQMEQLQTDKPFWRPSDISQKQFNLLFQKRSMQDFIQNINETPDKEAIKKSAEITYLLDLVLEHPYNEILKKYVLMKLADDIVNNENIKLNTYLKVVLIDRNNQVLEDIFECLQNSELKKVGVCFGAFHMKGIVDKLLKEDFIFQEEIWITCWNL